MALVTLRSSDAGAPALQGVNGSLCTVLDWALPQNGWAIEFSATNKRVYRPGVGNRRRLWVQHDSTVSGNAILATMRGCEGATSATAVTDAFPTEAQLNNSSASFCVANNATGEREYVILLHPEFVVMAVATASNTTTGWDLFLFGDLAGTMAGDVYATICLVGNTSSATAGARGMNGSISAVVTGAGGKAFFCRSIDGSVKSERGTLHGAASQTTSSFCSATGTPNMREGYSNRIVREKVAVSSSGSALVSTGAMAVMKRGWVPNLWNPLHTGIGAVTSDDRFTDSAYDLDSLFQIAPAANTTACILELTDTWAAPVG